MVSDERKKKILKIDWIKEIIESDQDMSTVVCSEGHTVSVRTKGLTRTDYIKHCPICKESKRQNSTKKCLNCGKELKPGQEKFCSNSCSATYNNFIRAKKLKSRTKTCAFCGSKFESSSRKYCSDECKQKQFQSIRHEKLKKLLKNGCKTVKLPISIREELFKKYNNSCQKCGWNTVNEFTKKVPLQVHHIDGDPSNNSLDNLQLLCPNCHSLTDTFGIKNKGKGRESRRKYRYMNDTNN